MRALLLALAITASLGAQADPFSPVRFLLGEWRGEGDGRPGQASGAAIFRFELDGKALVRRSHADYPATNGRPAAHHEDLMTIFVEGEALKAFYLDNEGHVIRYSVSTIPGGVAFISDPGQGPRFRLTYLKKSPEVLVTVRFEIAPPGKPEGFSTYLEADTRRVP